MTSCTLTNIDQNMILKDQTFESNFLICFVFEIIFLIILIDQKSTFLNTRFLNNAIFIIDIKKIYESTGVELQIIKCIMKTNCISEDELGH